MKPGLILGFCGALLGAMAGVAAAAQSDNTLLWARSHLPMRPYFNPDGTFRRFRGTVETQNWSGYAVTASAPYTSAAATWQVPSVTNDGVSGSTEYVLDWVGIGGYGDQTLIQLGTEAAVSTTGVTSFQAWYELYPAYLLYVPLTIYPGDVITASLQCTASCTASQTQTWQLTIADLTRNAAWTESFQYHSSMASAEWITEEPYSGSGSAYPLANYGKATYDPVAANGQNPNLSLAANGVIADDPWGETSNPSPPVSGDVFSTCWGAKGAGLTPCSAGSVTVPTAPASSPPPPPPPPPAAAVTVSLAASPTTLSPGQAAKLTWTSTNATSCVGNGFTVGNNGRYVTGPFAWALVFPKVTTSYGITCTGSSGSASAMVTVTVI